MQPNPANLKPEVLVKIVASPKTESKKEDKTSIISSYPKLKQSLIKVVQDYKAHLGKNKNDLGARRADVILHYANQLKPQNHQEILALLFSVFRPDSGLYSFGRSNILANAIAREVIKGNNYRDSFGHAHEDVSSESLENVQLRLICSERENENLSGDEIGNWSVSVVHVKAMREVLRNALNELDIESRNRIMALARKFEAAFKSKEPLEKLDISVEGPSQEMQVIKPSVSTATAPQAKV